MNKIQGIVISGKETGRKIGFPTINIEIEDQISKDKFGVYTVKIFFNDKEYLGMANVGFSKTFESTTPLLEVHIFNFNKDIYGEKVEIELIKKIRETIKFNSVEALKKQLEKDKEEIIDYKL